MVNKQSVTSRAIGEYYIRKRGVPLANLCSIDTPPEESIARTVYDRPYVTLKWAESADGKVAGAGGKRVQISNPRATKLVHELRARCDAITVGINTVLSDDPLLIARDVHAARPLIRVVLDSQLRIPMESKLVRTARQHRVIVFYDRRLAEAERNKLRELEQAGVQPFLVERRFDGLNLEQVLTPLAHFGVTHVLVEPGPTLANAFFNELTLADRVWLVHSPNKIDAVDAQAGIGVPGHYVKAGEIDVDGDRVTEYLNPQSPVFFSATASADFVIAQKPAP